jgi:hypothetical protein
MNLPDHPSIASGWATLIWESRSYGRGDKFSNVPAGSEEGTLIEVTVEPSPSNELHLTREYSEERQTASLEVHDPHRTKLYELLKRSINKPVAEVGSLSVDEDLNSC